MTEFWLDTNVFIGAARGPYGFDIAPGFWVFLDEMVGQRRIASPQMVYRELTAGEDQLATWVKDRRTSGLFIEPDATVQVRFGEIATYVYNQYDAVNAGRFLEVADPWLIAHASVQGGTVVTLETLVPPNAKKVKIPNVCNQFAVRWTNTYQMLRDLGASLGG